MRDIDDNISDDPRNDDSDDANGSEVSDAVVWRSEIKKEAAERAKKQPILRRIIKSLSRSDKVFRELILSCELTENRVALLEDGILENYEFEYLNEKSPVGAIFRGKIQNLEPGLKAAFVDIGEEKNTFLHYWDILPAANDKTFEVIRKNTSKQRKNITLKDIPRIYSVGTDIIVQIIKGQIGTKGPRVTTNISLPGKCLVLMPFSDECGISKRIDDGKERNRLKDILNKLTIPDGMGVIVRTAGIGKKARHFVRDLHILLQTWNDIMERYEKNSKPTLLHEEPDLVERTVRDFLTDDVDRIIVNDSSTFDRMLHLVSAISPRSKQKFHLFTENIPLFDRFNVERQIEQTFASRVPLACGGEIVINETEALTSIDVNTRNHRSKKKDSGHFIFDVNFEAGKEIARQLRLRNIGGLIVIDFVDMVDRRDRTNIFNLMRTELSKDRAKNFVLPISQLGLMEISRQRHSQSNNSEMRTVCQYCGGDGLVKSPRTMCNEIYRKLAECLQQKRGKFQTNEKIKLKITLNGEVLERMKNDERSLVAVENKFNAKLMFRSDTSLHMEKYKIVDMMEAEDSRD
ncbi:MAG: Rne/Rng family ribonuclease [Puniceicoccales bacterium]|jgi:ribonuclease G|nr:Rne/Rng family ribonuclease [Puniceicoccales bacterium]